jgi:hypothetical protein
MSGGKIFTQRLQKNLIRMAMKRNLLIVLSISLLILILACITSPGSTQVQQIPTININTLQVSIAQTAQAAVSMTSAAVNNTPLIPPPTDLLITPTATLIPPTRISPPEEGTFLAKQENGTTQFFDQSAGYNLVIPAGWAAIRVKGPEYSEVFASAATKSAEFQAAIKNTQSQNGDVFRLFAFNMKDVITSNQFFTNMNFVWDIQDNGSLDETVKKIESQYPKIFPGMKIVNIGVITTAKGIPYGLIESTTTIKNDSGQGVTIYQKQAVFNLHNGKLYINLSVPAELKDPAIQDFDLVLFEFYLK